MKKIISLSLLLTSTAFLAGCTSEPSNANSSSDNSSPAEKTTASVSPVSDPNNTGEWVLNEEVSDEFNGDGLDYDKWQNLGKDGDYYNRWKGRAPSQFNADNVSVEGGYLTLTSRWQPEFKFYKEKKFNNGYFYGEKAPITTAAIITKKKFKYGYMEVRAKAADGPVSSSYWTTGKDGEMDVFEHYGHNPKKPHSGKKYHTSFHDWRVKDKVKSPTYGKRIWTNDHILDFRVADDFHVYGYEWDENYVKIFVDGRLVNCVTKEAMGDKWVAYNEQMVWIDSETFEWEMKPENIKESDFGEDGQKFVVDYSRIWQHSKPGSGCVVPNNIVTNASFENGLEGWTGSATKTADANTGEAAVEFSSAGMLEQVVTVKPNTTYVLSAWAKSPQTNMKNHWFNGYMGVKGFGGKKSDNRFFLPNYHQKSLQFTTGSDVTSATIYFSNKPQGKSFVIDDVELVEAAVAADSQ